MALSKTYTVCGFGPGLDWRPTYFVDGIASNRVCSACGLVRSATALLPCRHVLCRPCYESCVAEHNRCPLDKEPLEKDDVVWSTLSKDRLLKREIWCWNECYGCDAVGPASEILEHFNDDCEFHRVICPQCGFGIPKTDIVDHHESASCAKNQAFMKQKE
ncbi:TNF receptor-associated factor 6-like [Haemaphysalis longicornis]